MSDRRRIVIRRRLPIESVGVQQPEGDSLEELEREKQVAGSQEAERGETRDSIDEALSSFNAIQQRIKELWELDRSIQRVFKKWDEVDLAKVKKKLNQLTDERNRLLSEAQGCEALLNEALGVLETRMSEIEEQLFDKLVEVEFIRERGAHTNEEGGTRLRVLESEAEECRNRIAEIKRMISDLQLKLDNVRALPRTILKLTTCTEEAEPLYRELVAKWDEAKVSSAIEKIMQDEGVARPYAIIHLWKAALRPRLSGQT